LIIFDLDDTLIDTTGSIAPLKMKLCLEYLEQIGLSVADFLGAYQELMDLNAVSLRSRDAIEQFIASRGGDPLWSQAVSPLMVSPLPENFSVPTTPFAKEILEIRPGARFSPCYGWISTFSERKVEKSWY